MTVRILTGDCRDVLQTLPSESVHCIVTSPPYYGLRDYGTGEWEGGDAGCDHRKLAYPPGRETPGGRGGSMPMSETVFRSECGKCGARRIDRQIGLEQSPDDYVAELVGVFRECRRVLRDDGTLWANLGDSYAANRTYQVPSTKGGPKHSPAQGNSSNNRVPDGLKPKDLIGIPWLVAFALRADGWYLRSDIIWAKPNPMPESVRDRPTKAHEYIFLLSKSERYYFDADAVREPISEETLRSNGIDPLTGRGYAFNSAITPSDRNAGGTVGWGNQAPGASRSMNIAGRNIRSVWTVATQPYSEAHFATFPPALIEPCIKAGTSEKGCCAKCGAPWKRVVEKGEADIAHQRACGGNAVGEYNGIATKDYAAAGAQNASEVKARILAGMREKITTGWSPFCPCNAAVVPCTVLDPFAGAGTTGMVADRLQRNAILIELNSSYAAMARERLHTDGGMFAEVAA